MKIYYDNLTESVTPVEFSASFPDEQIELKSFSGNIYKTEKKNGGHYYTLSGEAVFEYSGICDRCTGETVVSVGGNIQIYLTPEAADGGADSSSLYELSDEECDYYITHPDYMDLHNILRQETYLMLPGKITCDNCEEFVDIVEYDDAIEHGGGKNNKMEILLKKRLEEK
ncbi:MAG: hypothetical protein LBD73_06465 [Deferribacteraceae bacterium]|jgi:uncharacterized metal-binding protein YceD (DUF177 family)|nr:hypothetical protein [Deferribacteraceae bacterium]